MGAGYSQKLKSWGGRSSFSSPGRLLDRPCYPTASPSRRPFIRSSSLGFLDHFCLANLGHFWRASKTVYLFGFGNRSRLFRGFAYRSENGFASEVIQQNAFGWKPVGQSVAEAFNQAVKKSLEANPADLVGAHVSAFVEAMKIQKTDDDSRPNTERVRVGGEIQVVTMTESAMKIETAHRFDDFAATGDQFGVNNTPARSA